MKKIFYSIILIVSLIIGSYAEEKNLQRRYVPIILQGSILPMSNFVYADWRAYRYHEASSSWQLVPFQADEKDSKGRYNRENDGIIDSNDELVFMPEDLGDRAPGDQWLADAESRGKSRLEFEFSELLDPSKKAWIYLFHNSQNPAGYLHYTNSSGEGAADTVKSAVYRVGHNQDGWIDFISLANDFKIDLIDRFKLRIAGEAFYGGIGKYAFTEDTLHDGRSIYYNGRIRGFHEMKAFLAVPQILSIPFDVDYQLHYFPYSMQMGVNDVQLDNPYYLVLAGAKLIRQSLDLSPNSTGMIFYSETNRDGLPIDGKSDQVNIKLASQSGAHWIMASGEQGSIFMVLEMPEIKNANTQLYYRDDQNVGTNDGTSDTGDKKSFGDMGLSVSGNVLVTNRVTLKFTIYLLPAKAKNTFFADSLFSWSQTPMNVSIHEQTDSGTTVRQQKEIAHEFRLDPPYPNPFFPERSSLQVQVHSAQQDFEVFVYNELGQLVACITPSPRRMDGFHILKWDGRDDHGRIPPPGIYFIHVICAHEILTQKIFLIH